MVHRAHESIKDVHELLTLQVPPEDIKELSSSVGELLTCMQGHWTAVDQAFAAFKQDEVCTASVYLTYKHTSICDRLITCALALAGTIQFSQARDKICNAVYSGFGKQVHPNFYPMSQSSFLQASYCT
jgi:hypothetical protein